MTSVNPGKKELPRLDNSSQSYARESVSGHWPACQRTRDPLPESLVSLANPPNARETSPSNGKECLQCPASREHAVRVSILDVQCIRLCHAHSDSLATGHHLKEVACLLLKQPNLLTAVHAHHGTRDCGCVVVLGSRVPWREGSPRRCKRSSRFEGRYF